MHTTAAYERVVPLTTSRHAESAVDARGGLGFSRHFGAVPLMAVEMPAAASEYVIVFIKRDETVMPAVILGLDKQQNLYLDAADRWQARYVPAYIRRYPFVFARHDETRFVLCLDEACPGFNDEGRGQRLFDAGKPTAFVDKALKFLQTYQTQFAHTAAFCQQLDALGLLQPMHARLTLADGEPRALTGFMGIDRAKLAALPDATLAAMAKNRELEYLYSHLHSLGNFAALKARAPTIPHAISPGIPPGMTEPGRAHRDVLLH